ncbi:TIGR02206 family membrane protein [Indiicoccus explosivorum]|uniref:YwaF family protein n=1 Tax=Indiicoccus explosivorum TaxID=1917864 RepID=UPI000B454377|nr:TIGR02206 family membrane protein [Indiicoccus explosivorum]
MTEWLARTSDHEFIAFSASHIAALAVSAAGVILLFLLKNQLAQKPERFQWLRWTLLTLLLLSEVSYQIWTVSVGIWTFADHVPLHLCGIASLLAMAALVTWNPYLVQAAFYFGFIPAFLALFTPELPFGFQHYRFWKFFVHHAAIPWASLYLALSRPSFITRRSVFRSYGILLVFAAAVGFAVNPLAGANYLYLSQLPTATTPLSFFGDGVLYYFNLCLVAFVLFYGQFVVWKLFIRPSADEKP